MFFLVLARGCRTSLGGEVVLLLLVWLSPCVRQWYHAPVWGCNYCPLYGSVMLATVLGCVWLTNAT